MPPSPLVSCIHSFGCFRMVIAGTGLSLRSIPEITSPLIAGTCEKEPSLEIKNLGGFYTREQIASCLRTLLFTDLAEDEEALQYLFDRIRGRARFLAGVLSPTWPSLRLTTCQPSSKCARPSSQR